ncbi:MAG: hypothetical protein ACLQVJ_12600 [Syntrophobacteraceae bacterium]
MATEVIPERQAELDQLLQEVFEPEQKSDDFHPALPVEPLDLDDEELLRRAREAKDGTKFSQLWSGNSDKAEYASHSEADLALCCKLAFWFGRDKERMDQVFRRSGLYRKKWD